MVFVNYKSWQSNISLQDSGAKYHAQNQEGWDVLQHNHTDHAEILSALISKEVYSDYSKLFLRQDFKKNNVICFEKFINLL